MPSYTGETSGTSFIELELFPDKDAYTFEPDPQMSQSDLTFGLSWTSEFLISAGLWHDAAYWSAETNCFGLTVLLLTFNINCSTSSQRKPIGSAHLTQFRRADTQIKSHRSIKHVIYDPLPMFSFFLSPSLPLSCFTSAHNILTKSFFDGGISHDSHKMALQQGRERNHEG